MWVHLLARATQETIKLPPTWIGVALMLGKTLIYVIGLQITSYATRGTTDPELAAGSGRESQILCRLFLLRIFGMTLFMAIGPLIEVMSYSLAPAALLAPINGVGVVWNILLAPVTLGEQWSQLKVIGTTMVFLGSLSAPILGPEVVAAETFEEMQEQFVSLRFVLYAAIFVLCFALGWVAVRRMQDCPGSAHRGGDCNVLRGVLLGTGGGVMSGQTYFLSAAATLVTSCIQTGDWSAWLHWLPYVIVIGAVTCAVLNAILLNVGLAEFEATFFVPMFSGSGIMAACLSAALVLQETERLQSWRRVLYWCCVGLIGSGLAVLAKDARSQAAAAKDAARTRRVLVKEDAPISSPISSSSSLALASWADGAGGRDALVASLTSFSQNSVELRVH
eukprot:TRINITY_DN87502_c0_g1_i1.p1 TRINITY_DN87502_c0_g1~~TRINITY_DN87502_c0_g1_i1.p1  ORF type:complete len:439 (+),score=60.48 TRINITY_DN87502_c0_g1_i1:142-1317(+)